MATAPILLGHRGARAVRSVPENTIVSFDLALEHGCDGVEFDLRLTGCGRALVCHNAKVGKIMVARATSSQLRHFPRFEDVLRHYGHRIFLDIELKVKGLESKVLEALRGRSLNGNYVISSFLPEVVMELKARSAVVPPESSARNPASSCAGASYLRNTSSFTTHCSLDGSFS